MCVHGRPLAPGKSVENGDEEPGLGGVGSETARERALRTLALRGNLHQFALTTHTHSLYATPWVSLRWGPLVAHRAFEGGQDGGLRRCVCVQDWMKQTKTGGVKRTMKLFVTTPALSAPRRRLVSLLLPLRQPRATCHWSSFEFLSSCHQPTGRRRATPMCFRPQSGSFYCSSGASQANSSDCQFQQSLSPSLLEAGRTSHEPLSYLQRMRCDDEVYGGGSTENWSCALTLPDTMRISRVVHPGASTSECLIIY